MAKNDTIKGVKRQKRDEIAYFLADKWGLSPRYVQMVRDGERKNDKVLDEYMALLQWFNRGKENLLLGAVEEMFDVANAPRITKNDK